NAGKYGVRRSLGRAFAWPGCLGGCGAGRQRCDARRDGRGGARKRGGNAAAPCPGQGPRRASPTPPKRPVKTSAQLKPPMDDAWNDNQPIYRQLRDRVIANILDGVLNEGDPLPSVRNVAAEFRVNPLTVLKAYQQLADEQIVEKRRGLGMFINAGARDILLQAERQKFMNTHSP